MTKLATYVATNILLMGVSVESNGKEGREEEEGKGKN